MPKKIINLGVINPVGLRKNKRNKILSAYLRAHKNQVFFMRDTPCHFDCGNVTYTFSLSHDILHRQSMKNPEWDRYEVVGHEMLGQGTQGSVFPNMATLKPQASGYLKSSHHIRRILKQSAYHADKHNEVQREAYLNRKIKRAGGKKLIISGTAQDKRYWLITHFLDGRDLLNVLHEDSEGDDKQLTFFQRLNLSVDLLRALQKLHDAGIIHRDIKLANILYDVFSGRVSLIDLGLAKEIDETNISENVGAPAYAPLEQWEDECTNEKSDVYTMGKVIAIVWRLIPESLFIDSGDKSAMLNDCYEFVKEDVVFDDLEFQDLTDIPDGIKRRILDVLLAMTVAIRDERLSVEQALAAFEEIRLLSELNVMQQKHGWSDEALASYEQAYRAGMAARNTCREWMLDTESLHTPNAVAELVKDHLDSLSDNPLDIFAFKHVFGMQAIVGLNDKKAIKKKLTQIVSEYDYVQTKIIDLQRALDFSLKQWPENEEKLAPLRQQLQRVLKKMDANVINLDDVSALTLRLNVAFEKMNSAAYGFDEHYNYYLARVIERMEQDVTGNPGEPQSKAALVSQIKHAIYEYFTMTSAKDMRAHKKAASRDRLCDMERILRVLQDEAIQDPAQMIRYLRQHLRGVKRGLFHTSVALFNQCGSSDLIDLVQQAMRNFERQAVIANESVHDEVSGYHSLIAAH